MTKFFDVEASLKEHDAWVEKMVAPPEPAKPEPAKPEVHIDNMETQTESLGADEDEAMQEQQARPLAARKMILGPESLAYLTHFLACQADAEDQDQEMPPATWINL